jgi:hypothetical protein
MNGYGWRLEACQNHFGVAAIPSPCAAASVTASAPFAVDAGLAETEEGERSGEVDDGHVRPAGRFEIPQLLRRPSSGWALGTCRVVDDTGD